MNILLKSRKSLIIFVFIFVLLITLIYIISNPPLSTSGMSYGGTNDGYRVVALRNDGVFSVSLRNVLVNGGEIPSSVELGVSRSGQMVLGGALDESAHITFHSIDEFKISPVLSPEAADRKLLEMQQTGEQNTIFHYGLRINHDNPIETVTINYFYLGIPLSHTLNVNL